MLTDNIVDLIGNTPLVRLRGENIYCKAESTALWRAWAAEERSRAWDRF